MIEKSSGMAPGEELCFTMGEHCSRGHRGLLALRATLHLLKINRLYRGIGFTLEEQYLLKTS